MLPRWAANPPSPLYELRGLGASDPRDVERRGHPCGWKHPRAPGEGLLFNDNRATFLRNTRVCQMVTATPQEEVGGGREKAREEGKEEERRVLPVERRGGGG